MKKKKDNINEKSVGLGLVFGVMFFIVLDSIVLGISLGFAMFFAFEHERKRKNKK